MPGIWCLCPVRKQKAGRGGSSLGSSCSPSYTAPGVKMVRGIAADRGVSPLGSYFELRMYNLPYVMLVDISSSIDI